MPAQVSLPFPRLPGRASLALGVCLGNRTTGLALATRERLLRAEVATVQGNDVEERADALTARIEGIVTAYTPSQIALVNMHAPAALGPLLAALRARLEALRATAEFSLTEYDALAVRRAYLPEEGVRPTNRSLVRAIAWRFPELADPTRSRPSSVPCVVRVFPTSRERRASRLFLAVGGALHDLDEGLKRRIVS